MKSFGMGFGTGLIIGGVIQLQVEVEYYREGYEYKKHSEKAPEFIQGMNRQNIV